MDVIILWRAPRSSDASRAWPTYGYRRVTAQLEREHAPANHKRVQWGMLAMVSAEKPG